MVRPQDRVRCVDGARTPWVFGTCPRGDDGQEWPGDSGMAVRSCRLTARAIDDGGRADMGRATSMDMSTTASRLAAGSGRVDCRRRLTRGRGESGWQRNVPDRRTALGDGSIAAARQLLPDTQVLVPNRI